MGEKKRYKTLDMVFSTMSSVLFSSTCIYVVSPLSHKKSVYNPNYLEDDTTVLFRLWTI